MESLLGSKQITDLASLLDTVSAQAHLSSDYRDQTGYWASQVGLGLDTGNLQVVASLLEDAAGSPWLPDPLQQWARAWAMTISELTGQDAY